MDVQIQMRIVVDDQTSDVVEVKRQLAECVEGMDPRPRFQTVAHWLVEATEKLGSNGGPPHRVTGDGGWMPQGHTKRRRTQGPMP